MRCSNLPGSLTQSVDALMTATGHALAHPKRDIQRTVDIVANATVLREAEDGRPAELEERLVRWPLDASAHPTRNAEKVLANHEAQGTAIDSCMRGRRNDLNFPVRTIASGTVQSVSGAIRGAGLTTSTLTVKALHACVHERVWQGRRMQGRGARLGRGSPGPECRCVRAGGGDEPRHHVAADVGRESHLSHLGGQQRTLTKSRCAHPGQVCWSPSGPQKRSRGHLRLL